MQYPPSSHSSIHYMMDNTIQIFTSAVIFIIGISISPIIIRRILFDVSDAMTGMSGISPTSNSAQNAHRSNGKREEKKRAEDSNNKLSPQSPEAQLAVKRAEQERREQPVHPALCGNPPERNSVFNEELGRVLARRRAVQPLAKVGGSEDEDETAGQSNTPSTKVDVSGSMRSVRPHDVHASRRIIASLQTQSKGPQNETRSNSHEGSTATSPLTQKKKSEFLLTQSTIINIREDISTVLVRRIPDMTHGQAAAYARILTNTVESDLAAGTIRSETQNGSKAFPLAAALWRRPPEDGNRPSVRIGGSGRASHGHQLPTLWDLSGVDSVEDYVVVDYYRGSVENSSEIDGELDKIGHANKSAGTHGQGDGSSSGKGRKEIL